MPEDQVESAIVMMPADVSQSDVPGATLTNCDKCGTMVWQAPSTAILITRLENPVKYCWRCAAKQAKELDDSGEEFHMGKITDEQKAEIIAALGKERGEDSIRRMERNMDSFGSLLRRAAGEGANED